MGAAGSRLAGAAVAALVLMSSAAADAAPSAHSPGSASGYAAFQRENRANARARTIELTQTGGAWLYVTHGSDGAASWLWASPVGGRRVPARVTATVEVHNGRVVWSESALSPACRSARCRELPVVVLAVGTSSAPLTYYAFGTPAAHTCFSNATGPQYPVGSSIDDPVGRFGPARTSGGLVSFTDAYPWPGGRRATETDTITEATGASTRTHLVVSAGGGLPRFSLEQTYRYGPAEGRPALRLC